MKIIVNENRTVAPIGTWGTKNENNYEILDIELPEKFNDYNKRIVYYLGDEIRWDIIVDNKVFITNAVTKFGKVKAYIWLTKDDDIDIDFRTQLFEMRFNENQNADGLIPSEEQIDGFNDMLTVMNNKIEEVNNIDIDLSEKVDGKVTLTITKKDGTTEETEILDGEKGDKGDKRRYRCDRSRWLYTC